MSYDSIVRLMTCEDIQGVLTVERAAFLTPWSQQTFETEMENQLAHYLVMEKGNSVIGYAGMWIILDEAHVTNVALLSDYRGQGLGTKLMTSLMEYAKRHGAGSMTLEVRVNNFIAQKLYTKLGFVAGGLRPDYYTDTHEDALIMWCYNL